MAEEKTTPEEAIEPKEEEVEEERREVTTPHPDVLHRPIEIDAVNLNTLQNQAFLQSLGQEASAKVSYADTPLEVQSGDELLVTLTLASPVGPDELPYVVDIVYEATQNNAKKTSGIFLYKQTTVATFTPGLPNNGNLIQEFHLQTIRFDLQHAKDGPADIAIHLHHKGEHVGKHGTGKFRIHPGG